MKNIKFKIVALLASLVISLSSCSDFFELDYPASDLPEWQTVSDVEYMVISCYELMFSQGSWAGNVVANFEIYSQSMSDVTHIIPQIGQSQFYIHRRLQWPYDADGGVPSGIYSSIYQCIRSANTVIAWADMVNAGEVEILSVLSDSDQAMLDRMQGEAYFMRAYGYWMAAQSFMPPYSDDNRDNIYIPVIDQSYFTAEDVYNPPMGTMGEIYDLMLSDCAMAIEKMELSGTSDYDIQVTRRGFANKYAAAALLMRLQFATQQWSDALVQCKYIIDSGLYNLDEQPIRAYNRDTSIPADFQYAKEVIFEAAYDGDGALTDEPWGLARITKIGFANFSYGSTNDITGAQTDPNWTLGGRGVNWTHRNLGAVTWNPQIVKYIGWTDEIESDGLSFDLNEEGLTDLRCQQLHYHLLATGESTDASVAEAQWSIPWKNLWFDKYFRSPGAAEAQVPLIRYAEVLLTQADCALAAGDTATALTAINTVRNRAGLESLTSVTTTDIEKERIKELGADFCDRQIYLSAHKLPMYSNGKLMTNEDSATYGSEVEEVPYPYNDFHMYLPDSEINYSGTWQEVVYY